MAAIVEDCISLIVCNIPVVVTSLLAMQRSRRRANATHGPSGVQFATWHGRSTAYGESAVGAGVGATTTTGWMDHFRWERDISEDSGETDVGIPTVRSISDRKDSAVEVQLSDTSVGDAGKGGGSALGHDVSDADDSSRRTKVTWQDRLKAKVPESADAATIAQDWLSAFSESLNAQQDVQAAKNLFLAESYWRDILALTSDIRSLKGWESIRALLDSRGSHLASLHLLQAPHNRPVIDSPFPDLSYVQFTFEFETPIGRGSGIGRLVPGADEKWRAFTIFTCLDALKNYEEKVGVNRSTTPILEPWEALRQGQADFTDEQPQALVIGGGQAGLEIAARLKHLDVPTLVIERTARIGDSVWRSGLLESMTIF
ncbi:hypothetical protein DXG03_001409 [Asterophora parasitica]|uniref:FAD/NAD(P)-binding domain-containing protein n=1 Tax=Asterophora parasitica TaxID=117018 RepID=A0A9P7KF20_9AGAR|nr:hypothetical protein DXG03_001409 [Asterophora parasitica]